MGQKNSIYEYTNVPQDLEKLQSISEQFEQLTKKMADDCSKHDQTNLPSSTSNLDGHQLESHDPLLSPREIQNDNNITTVKTCNNKNHLQNMYVIRNIYKGLNADSLSFILNPSIAEISQITAMRMIKKFEEESAVPDEAVENGIIESNENLDSDILKENEECTISYENILPEPFINESEIFKGDSAADTTANEESLVQDFNIINSIENTSPPITQYIKSVIDDVTSTVFDYESPIATQDTVLMDTKDVMHINPEDLINLDDNKDIRIDVRRDIPVSFEDVMPIENEETESASREAKEAFNHCSEYIDEGTDIMSQVTDEKHDEVKTTKWRNEILNLREKLNELKCEQKEAQNKLKIAEHKCELYKMESQSLEAALHCMEDKLSGEKSEF
ncbi:PREDICTED: uncharacterized protein LOC105364248 [Ceratosolen solmsi marchali]|uniref:Uncharacterized protein LOC105364248 n=1 Tax=Ceratosolen solmsi marchali TaxID=326594 RepID=A0AAJ6YLS2_9HYME|nr:PREDICTED: uncharacterized protein LOC105364248 [Ceratosolen solmsi marchali]